MVSLSTYNRIALELPAIVSLMIVTIDEVPVCQNVKIDIISYI